MMPEIWETGWDPLEALQQCQHNIHQLAIAHNQQTDLVKQLARSLQHQQEVIQQLQISNRRLTEKIQQLAEQTKNI